MNCEDEHGWMALSLVIEDGHEAVMQQLLKGD
jgi:hypothetical protein